MRITNVLVNSPDKIILIKIHLAKPINKAAAILACLAIMILCPALTSAAQANNPGRAPIIIGGDHSYPPFEYLDTDGKPTGFNADITRAVLREVGREAKIRLGPWIDVLEKLEKGKIDALQGMFYSPGRDKKFDFSSPYLVSHYISVVRKGSGSPPDTLVALEGKRIAVENGDIMHDYLQKNGLGTQILVATSQEDALLKLAKGQCDCALTPRFTAFYWIKKHGLNNLIVGQHPFLSLEYCFAVRQNDKALLANFNEGLKAIEKTGEYRRIHDKWFGIYDPLSPNWNILLRYIAMVALPLLLIMSAIFIWSWTLRKQVARRTAELQKEESRRHILLDQSRDGIVALDRNGKVFEANRQYAEMLGYTLEETRQLHIWDWDARWTREELLKILGSERTEHFFETRHRRKDGTCFDVEISSKRGVIGGKWLSFCVCRDITERKRTEKALREGEAKYRLLAENASDVIWIYSLEENRYTYVSPSVEKMFGYTVEEALKIPLKDHMSKEKFEEAQQIQNKILGEDPSPLDGAFFEIEQRKKDGSWIWTDAVLSVVRGENERPASILGITRDITERKQAEKEKAELQNQLIRAQKMESIGRLAGGVAHDFNNMLSIIIGHAENMQEDTDPADPHYENLREILNAAKNSADITRQLLAFARQQTISPKVLDLNEVVGQTYKMLKRLLGEDIELSWEPHPDQCLVKMDPSQIDQILANLCVNARDAITDTGLITIRTENKTLDESASTGRPDFIPGEYALLSVSDNGSGMDKETLEKIFEPFFTTKDLSQGTGLGMATVYGIVQQNYGFIDINSEPQKGTTIKIFLPRHSGMLSPTQEEGDTPTPKGKGETILLVEDDPSILKLTRANLENLGYTPISASSPAEALDLAEKHSGGIHLLITDVIMPEMNGRDLAERLLHLFPHLKCLFMSGYPASAIAQHGVLEKGFNFIQKPFLREDLAAKITEVLGAGRNQA